MKFSIASLFAGSALIIAPLISHAYELHVFESLISIVMITNGSAYLPETPTLWYAVSCLTGLALIILGYRLESHAIRSASLSNNSVPNTALETR